MPGNAPARRTAGARGGSADDPLLQRSDGKVLAVPLQPKRHWSDRGGQEGPGIATAQRDGATGNRRPLDVRLGQRVDRSVHRRRRRLDRHV